jgi:hypothetical protein
MTRGVWRPLVAFGACSLLATGLGAQATTLQVAPECTITGAALVDVDGDGQDDLVLACYDQAQRRREVHVHRRTGGARPFAQVPTAVHALDRDVTGFLFADCDPAPGRELVLCAPERVVALLPGPDGNRYEVLAELPLVWPAAMPELALLLTRLRVDAGGSGRDDLCLPTVDGAVLLLGCRQPVPLAVPVRRAGLPTAGGGPARSSRDQVQLSLSLGDGDGDDGDGDGDGEPSSGSQHGAGARERGPLLTLRARAPRAALVDADGDGRLDLLALRNGELWVRRQTAPGQFAAAEALALPLGEDRLQFFDPAFDVQLLPGQGRADLLLTTTGKRGDELEVRIDRHAAAERGFRPEAASRLRVQALASPPQLADADGDGQLDLCLLSLRPDLLKSLGEGPQQLELQCSVFRGDGGRFATPALLTTTLQVPLSEGRGSEPFVRLLAGPPGQPGELLLLLDAQLVVRPLTRAGNRLQLEPPRTSIPVPAKARPIWRNATATEVLVRNEHELLHVRLR